MSVLPIIYAPNDIFHQKAAIVKAVNDDIRLLIDKMVKTMYVEQAAGLAANMVSVLKRIAVVDWQEEGKRAPYIFINPEITWRSEIMQIWKESSLSFPAIEVDIARPKAIKMTYLDYQGNKQALEAEGFLATVIQHQVDYLDGKIFLDYISKLKRDMLVKKMIKWLKFNPPHRHGGSDCHH